MLCCKSTHFLKQCVGGSVLITVGNSIEILCEKANQVININNGCKKRLIKPTKVS